MKSLNSDAERVYDMIIIGGGPAGYTSALYGAMAGFDVLLIEKMSAGGQMVQTNEIDNYPGFEDGIDGFTLGEKMKKQAEKFGAKTVNSEVLNLNLDSETKVIEAVGAKYYSKTVVIATGAGPRELGLKNESELVGRGVAYCASCDGMFYRGKTVVVVGGGNTAVEDALLLSRIAKKVILVHRRETFRATKVYYERLLKSENVEFRLNSVVEELLHDEKITGVRIKNVIDGKLDEINCDGIFISIGRKPATDFIKNQIALDGNGYVIAGEDMKTNVEGVYAVGDVRAKALRQIVTAVSDGAIAVHSAEEYLANID